ncbi:polysaccharide deacetylase family protein [Prosthecobacter sp.]|uniref:polysaccharide deacetylase family protein n=1 Tax=Prosthecobacter sp. TaxID=1965333 RepID=UPI003784DE87
MFHLRLPALFFLTAAVLNAQQASTPMKIEVRRALPVEEDAAPQPKLPDVATLPRVMPPNRKSVYNHCDVKVPLIAITFDDGPDPVLTPRLLDLLKERHIHATFFLVGKNAAAYPNVVKRIVDEGHEVGNHSWSHPLFTQMSKDSVESQLQRTHDAIVKACGVAPLFYRPPYGAVGVSQKARIEKTFGYASILWDVDPQDWKHPRSAQKVYNAIHSQTRNGSIILCHDIHETTIAAMPATLDDLTARGFRFATVTQLIAFSTPPEEVSPAVPATTTPPALSPSEPTPAVKPTNEVPAPGKVPAPAALPPPAAAGAGKSEEVKSPAAPPPPPPAAVPAQKP